MMKTFIQAANIYSVLNDSIYGLDNTSEFYYNGEKEGTYEIVSAKGVTEVTPKRKDGHKMPPMMGWSAGVYLELKEITKNFA